MTTLTIKNGLQNMLNPNIVVQIPSIQSRIVPKKLLVRKRKENLCGANFFPSKNVVTSNQAHISYIVDSKFEYHT